MRNRMRIPIRLEGADGVRYEREPLTFGVPFAEGAFPAGTGIRAMTADGRELPLQTSVMTTWKKDLRDVKWLLADIQADPATDGETVWLEASEASSPSNQSSPSTIAITQAEGLLTLDTGALRLTLRTAFNLWRHRECDSPFAGCAIKTADGWRETMHGAGLLLYMKDQHGNYYTSIGACPAPRVIIEEQGPLRVCVLITGHLTSEQGVLFCPYRLRIHLYAGKADLRIFHTFIFDQDPSRITLSAVGLKLLARPGDGATAAVGGEDGSAFRNHNWRCLSLTQADDLHYAASLDGKQFETGDKAQGWASLSASSAGVTAAVRDFWQEYPKGFKIERDALDVQVWPEEAGNPLSFLPPFREPAIFFGGLRDEEQIKRILAERPTAPISLKSFHVKSIEDVRWVEDLIARLAPERGVSYNDFMFLDTGIGAAKTTEIVLRFSDGPVSREDASAFAAAVQEPLFGIVDPEHMCGSGALGHFQPAGHPLFLNADRWLDEYFPKIVTDPVERCRLYGMFRYGNMICLHSPAVYWVYHCYKDTDPEKALRYTGGFNNESFDQIMSFWGQFLRTGDRRYLRVAQLASRATADVAFIHAYPGHDERVGCMHYHGAHPWVAGLAWSHALTRGIITDYYITGNRRLLDVALEAADGVVRNMTPSGILDCQDKLVREFTARISILMEAFQATWHDKYGAPAEKSLNWLLRAAPRPGWLPSSVYTRGVRGDEAVIEGGDCPPNGSTATLYHIYEPSLRIFPSGQLRQHVLAAAEWFIHPHPSKGIIGYDHPLICLGYDLTRDADYAAYALEVLDTFPREGTAGQNDDALCRIHTYFTQARNGKPGEKEEVLNLANGEFYGYIPPLMRTIVQAMEDDPGFLEFATRRRAEWRMQKDAPAQPREKPRPDGSLGRLSADPFP